MASWIMGLIKELAYIIGCLALGAVWFMTFALGYIMQGTWAGALSFAVNAVMNIALARKIFGEDGEREMIQNDYKFNQQFRQFVDVYCGEHGCTVEEALGHDEVKRAWRRYTEV